MEKTVREYQHMLRGPRFAWWRPLFTLVQVPLFTLLLIAGVYGVLAATGHASMARQALSGNDMSPVGFAMTNLILAALIPAAMLATRIAYGVKPGFVSSVAGRFRWGWTLRCAAIIVPLYALLIVVDQLTEGPEGSIPAQQALLLLMVLTTTPLQAAGEEYLFRGLVMQNVGAWFSHPAVAMAASTALSAGLFASAHGSTDVWVLLDLCLIALAACYLTWRTGGLEAAVVLHAVNNTAGMAASIFLGGWSEGFIDDNTRGDPTDLLGTVLVIGATVPLVLRAAARHGIQRVYQPPAGQPPDSDAVGSRRMNAWLWTAATVPTGLALLFGAAGVVMMVIPKPKLRLLHYTDIATPMGITSEGCLKGLLIDSLPIEIRHYQSRELVADDVTMQLGEQVITGTGGLFQFPVSGELMAANPEFHVVQPDGKRIDYRYQFRSATLPFAGKCPTPPPP